jgi:tol-pal system-associated acyl-CoA thioesterase
MSETVMSPAHVLPVTVYYEDTDFTGVVYYANYLRYFERARDEFFGIPDLMDMYARTGIGFAVYKAEIHYREGARFGDRLEVRTSVRPESEYRILCEQSVWRHPAAQPLVKALIQMVCVNTAQKLVALPEWVLHKVSGPARA